jgi:hypothetical protein
LGQYIRRKWLDRNMKVRNSRNLRFIRKRRQRRWTRKDIEKDNWF